MSRVVMPRAYSAMIRSLNPSRRVWPLRTICGSKLPVAVPGHLQLDRPDVGQHRLAGGAVAAVTRPAASRVVLLIAQVPGHLLSQRPLQHRLGHLRQQPIGAQQLGPLRLRLAQQLIGELLIDKGPPAGGSPSRLRGTIEVSVIACPSASRLSCGSSSGHVTYTAGRTRPAELLAHTG